MLAERPVKAIYNSNYPVEEVHTDASKLVIGGILLQQQDDDLCFILVRLHLRRNRCIIVMTFALVDVFEYI